MANSVLNVIIEERQNLSNIDDKKLRTEMNTYLQFSSQHCQVFKDYILSSEVFYIDTHA